MLSDEDAWQCLSRYGCMGPLTGRCFVLSGTRGNRVAPSFAWLQFTVSSMIEVGDCSDVGDLLQLWHALASCPGFSAAENPAFWRRVLHKVFDQRQDLIERACVSPDIGPNGFPSLRVVMLENDQHESVPLNRVPSFESLLGYVLDLHGEGQAVFPPSPMLLTALATLQPHIDMDRFSRSIPVQLVYQVPHRQYQQSPLSHDCSRNLARMHEFLLVIQSSPASVNSCVDTVLPRPRYTVQSVQVVGIHNLSDAMYNQLIDLMEDPRLDRLTFPRLGIAKIQRASLETFDRFLQYVLRPSTGDLLPKPRLPQTLTLKCSQSAMSRGHLETFFQLLPFTQAIRSLTLNGMGNSWQLWAWLGFALFHPSASSSSLRKLSFLRHTKCLYVGTLWLFVEAASLRMSCAEEFAYVVESYAQEHPVREPNEVTATFVYDNPIVGVRTVDHAHGTTAAASVMEALASVLETDHAIPSTTITSIKIDLCIHARSGRRSTERFIEQQFDMTAWTLVLAMLSPTLKHIYVAPLYRHVYSSYKTRLFLASEAVLMLVKKCAQLVSLSIPMEAWTETQLAELLETTRSTMQSFEGHAPEYTVHRVLNVLNRAAQSAGQYALRAVSLIVRIGCLKRDGASWRLIDELLESASQPKFCLEYLYVHMERLELPTNSLGFGDPVGEATRRLKRFHGGMLPHARGVETAERAMALLSVVVGRLDAVCGRLDAVMIARIIGFMRPLVRRHVGIDWKGISGIHTMDDEADTFGTDPDRDPGW